MSNYTYYCRACGAEKHWSGGGFPPEYCRACIPQYRAAFPVFREFTRQSFADRALCAQADPDLFTPMEQGDDRAKKAKKVCGRCPVISECLQWALDNDETVSVFGGMTARERRQFKRKQEAA